MHTYDMQMARNIDFSNTLKCKIGFQIQIQFRYNYSNAHRSHKGIKRPAG